MALPKITHPVFKITIPSLGKPLSFRPYTVKEEKLLLFMKDNDNISEAVDTIKQIIGNCCVETLDIDSLALFDIEYIFVKLRSKSVNNTIDLVYRKGEMRTDFIVDLDTVEIKFNPEHQKRFVLHNDIGVTMKYPSFSSMIKLENAMIEDRSSNDFIFDLFIECVESVFDDGKVYNDFTKEEMDEFILSLPRECVDKIKNFFDTMPVLEHKQTVRYKDGTTEEITLNGLKDFFIF